MRANKEKESKDLSVVNSIFCLIRNKFEKSCSFCSDISIELWEMKTLTSSCKLIIQSVK